MYCGSSHHLASATGTVRLKVHRIPGVNTIWVESNNISKLVGKPVILRLRTRHYYSRMAGTAIPTSGAIVIQKGGKPR